MNLLHAWYLLLNQPSEMVVSFACLLVSASCVLLVNDMPRGLRRLPEKMLISWISIGAFAGAAGPFFGTFIHPTWAELMMYSGVASWSLWLTWPYWRELPVLNRRKARRVDGGDYDEDHRVA